MIQNPILRGFNPDPCICRAGDDYYIATSTFEWFPGVQIHHSKDLKNWRLVTRPLSRQSQLNMHGNPNSGGIWAPALSYHDGLFYLIYTDVKTWAVDEIFKDTHNYMVTAENIEGPWSEPIYMNSSGFDPSLFHDDDGRKWFLNMVWDHRKGKNQFGGILLQEYSVAEQKLVGDIKNIFKGTEIGVTEASHIYKVNDWYYLMTAEGGTSYEHAVTLARSKTLDGPYEVHPDNPLLTAWHHPDIPIQKSGHASWVQTPDDEWYLAHLCGRPLEERGRCNLGRETAIQKLRWDDDGWPRLATGGNHPQQEVPESSLAEHIFEPEPITDDFDSDTLSLQWQTLRIPHNIPHQNTWLKLGERPSHLRIHGHESLISRHRQSLIARRLQAFNAEAETCVEFSPTSFQQMAGIAAYYDTSHWVYLQVSWDEEQGKSLNIMSYDARNYDEALATPIAIGTDKVFLKVVFKHNNFHFEYATTEGDWQAIGNNYAAGLLSDDYCNGLSFTGTFIALCVQDLTGQTLHADFDYFKYEEFRSDF